MPGSCFIFNYSSVVPGSCLISEIGDTKVVFCENCSILVIQLV